MLSIYNVYKLQWSKLATRKYEICAVHHFVDKFLILMDESEKDNDEFQRFLLTLYMFAACAL